MHVLCELETAVGEGIDFEMATREKWKNEN